MDLNIIIGSGLAFDFIDYFEFIHYLQLMGFEILTIIAYTNCLI